MTEKAFHERKIRFNLLKCVGIDEKEAIKSRIDDLPSWVYFPDQERAEFVNKWIKQAWPHLKVRITQFMLENLEPTLNQYVKFDGNIRFEEINLGDLV